MLCSLACGMINRPVLCALQTKQRQILVPLGQQRQAHNFCLVGDQLACRQLEHKRAFFLGVGCPTCEENNTFSVEPTRQGKRGRGAQEKSLVCTEKQQDITLGSQIDLSLTLSSDITSSVTWHKPLNSSEPIFSPVA